MSSKKSLWLVSKYATSSLFGPPNRQFFIAKFLKAKGLDVTLISSRSCAYGTVERFRGLYKTFHHEGLRNDVLNGPVVHLGFSFRRFLSWIIFETLLFVYSIINYRRRPAVLYVSSLSILSFLTCSILKRIFRCKLVVEVRDIWPATLKEFSNFNDKSLPFKILSTIEKIGYNNADLIIGTMPKLDLHVSTIVKKQFQYLNIPMGYDARFYNLNHDKPISEKDLRTLEDIKTEIRNYRFSVAYAGTIGKANCIDDLLEAARYLGHDIGIFIIGNGPLKNEFMQTVAGVNNIKFFDAVLKESLPKILSNFDVLINMWDDKDIYRYGVSPNKWIDYMLSSRPILVSFNGYRSIIDEAGCGWFIKARQPELIARKIEEIRSTYSDKELSEMGRRGYQYVLSNLNYESLTKKILDKLDSLK